MSEELRTVGPPIAVTVWFCRECNGTWQGGAAEATHRLDCAGEPEALRYDRITEDDDMVGLVTKVIADADLNGSGVPGYEELARAALRAVRGELS